jgi:hypothetical protein
MQQMAEATAWVKSRYPDNIKTHTSSDSFRTCSAAGLLGYDPFCVCGPPCPSPESAGGQPCSEQDPPPSNYSCGDWDSQPWPCADDVGDICGSQGPLCQLANSSTPAGQAYESGDMMYISDLQGGEVVKIEAAPRMLRFRVDATGSPDFLIGFQGFQTFREQFQSVFPRTRNSVENFPRIAAGVFPWRNPILPGTFNPCNGQEDLINNDDVPDNNNAFERGARFYWDTGFTLFARTGQVGGVDGDVCASNYNELQQYDNISINFHSSPIRKIQSFLIRLLQLQYQLEVINKISLSEELFLIHKHKLI